jgi:transcriptional regulator with GAF, ATPase, and Fis domain
LPYTRRVRAGEAGAVVDASAIVSGDAFASVVTRSALLSEQLLLAARVAPTDLTILITGESGTGKEVLAHAIHRSSSRARKSLVPVNCAAIPEGLLESELFGHRRGAFTGACEDHRGLVGEASGGTLFLDEIGDLPLTLQGKLLRFLHDGSYLPVGQSRPMQGDTRVIAASNVDLRQRVTEGRFRNDLYYRLAAFPIRLPPLRERPEDVVVLAQHFLARLAARDGRPVPRLSRDAVDYLSSRQWPGNVRELEHLVERTLLMTDESLLTACDFRALDPVEERADLGVRPGALPEQGVNLPGLVRDLVAEALRSKSGNVAAAARLLGLSRPALRYRMKKYGLQTRGPSSC